MNRIPCEVGRCGRTIGAERYRRQFKHEPGSWICPSHWKLVPRGLKRALARHRRERRKYGFYPRDAAHERLWRVVWRLLDLQG